MIARPSLLALLALLACSPAGAGTDTDAGTDGSSSTDMSPTTGASGAALALDGPCQFGPEDADELALVTNNFVDPAGLGRVDVGALAVTADVAPASTDTALGALGAWLVMVHRFGLNRIEVVDRADWSILGAVDVTHPGVADPNPQGVAFAADGLAYVPLFAAPAVQIYDFARAPADWLQGSIDLSAFADDDGSPEAGVALACGSVLFVGVQRLVNFVPVDSSYLVAVDLAARAVIDLDPDTEGAQAITLLGPYPKQFRRDPADPDAHTALVLTSGVERVDLVHGTSEWAVTPAALAAAGVDGFDLQAFVVTDDGAGVYIAATDGEFPNTAVFYAPLDLGDEAAVIPLVEGLTSGDRMLERIAGKLWVGDADPDDPRVRVFDLPDASELVADGLKTPIPPWTFIPLP